MPPTPIDTSVMKLQWEILIHRKESAEKFMGYVSRNATDEYEKRVAGYQAALDALDEFEDNILDLDPEAGIGKPKKAKKEKVNVTRFSFKHLWNR